MIGISSNPNSVYIPMYQSTCMNPKFDSTYPSRLNGIISPQEFQESIENINRRISSNIFPLTLLIFFALGIMGGFVLFAVGGATHVQSGRGGFPVLVIVGIVIFAVSGMLCGFTTFITQSGRVEKIRQAIAKESAKYSSRPIPCSWRLNILSSWYGTYGYYYRAAAGYNLVIEIGTNATSGSIVYQASPFAPVFTSDFGRSNNSAPMTFSTPSSMFCSQCGQVRQDLTPQNCSFCGHFNV